MIFRPSYHIQYIAAFWNVHMLAGCLRMGVPSGEEVKRKENKITKLKI